MICLVPFLGIFFVLVQAGYDNCNYKLKGYETPYEAHFQTTYSLGGVITSNFSPMSNCDQVGLYVKVCELSPPPPSLELLDLDNVIITRHNQDFYNVEVQIDAFKYCKNPYPGLNLTVVSTH